MVSTMMIGSCLPISLDSEMLPFDLSEVAISATNPFTILTLLTTLSTISRFECGQRLGWVALLMKS